MSRLPVFACAFLIGCFRPPDFDDPSFYASGADSSSASECAMDETDGTDGFDLPVPPTTELRCVFGPDDPATDDAEGYDLSFEIDPVAFDEHTDSAAMIAVMAPVEGILTYVDDPSLGPVAMIWWDDNPTALVVGGMTRTTAQDERAVVPGTVLGWIDQDPDGDTSLLTLGLRTGEAIEWTGASASSLASADSAPTAFRTRDVSWNTDPVDIDSDDFVCGPAGHIYASVLGE